MEKSVFLEGDLRIYLDSNKKPQIEYDGTESYFMGGWYFIKGTFFSPDHGCLVKDWFRRKIQAYRFHPDKVSFKKNIKITLDHGENNEIPVHYSSVAFWYSRP